MCRLPKGEPARGAGWGIVLVRASPSVGGARSSLLEGSLRHSNPRIDAHSSNGARRERQLFTAAASSR